MDAFDISAHVPLLILQMTHTVTSCGGLLAIGASVHYATQTMNRFHAWLDADPKAAAESLEASEWDKLEAEQADNRYWDGADGSARTGVRGRPDADVYELPPLTDEEIEEIKNRRI